MLYIPKDNRQITQIINNHRDKVSVTKQSDNQINIKNKKKACFVNTTIKSGTEKQYATYVPISVYTPLTRNINAYIRTSTPLLSGATTSKYKITYMKLKKYRSIKIVGTLGNYFYIDTKNENVGYNGNGFVKKSDVVYIECSPKFRTARVNTTRQIDVVVHNSGVSGLKWKTDRNRVFKKGKYTKKGKKKLPYTTKRTYNLKSKTEYAGYKTVSKRSATDRLFISSYSPTERIEGFITIKQSNKYDYVKLWKAATDDFGAYKQLSRYTKVMILGTCKDYYYIQHGSSKGYVKKVNVAYIGFGSFSRSMYRYHNNTISATLVHSDDDYNIKWSVTKNGSAITNKKIYNSSGYKKLSFFADKPKTVTFTAKYYYSGSRYISRTIKIKIKPIKIVMPKSISLEVGQNKKLPLKITSFKTLPSQASVKISSSSIVSLKKDKKNTRTLKAKSPGNTTVTVKFYDLKATCKVYVKPLLIYQTENLPGRSVNPIKNYNKNKDKYAHAYEAKDMHSADLTKKQIAKKAAPFNFSYNDFRKDETRLYKGIITLANDMTVTTVKIKRNKKVVKEINLRPVLIKMFSHFYNGSGTPFSDSRLTEAAINHESTQKYVIGVTKQLNNILSGTEDDTKKYKGKIHLLKYKHTIGSKNRRKKYKLIYKMWDNGISEPSYGNGPDYLNGLLLSVHGLWGNKIEVTKYNYNKKTGQYSGTLKFTLYDHFGLDNQDMTFVSVNKNKETVRKWAAIIGDFRSWFILQRHNKYKLQKNKPGGKHKPFITYITFTQNFSGKVKK